MAQAATSLRTLGTEQVNGAAAVHYLLTVDVTKIHGAGFTDAARVALTQAGITTLPVDAWVDSHSRPVKMSEKFSIAGQLVSTDVTIDQYNQPVAIAAPPASMVSTQ
jgi:hypothetical protein